MSVPNFDDVDLGIIVIGLVLLAAIVVIAINVTDVEGLKECLSFLGLGITAISTLAGRREKPPTPLNPPPNFSEPELPIPEPLEKK